MIPPTFRALFAVGIAALSTLAFVSLRSPHDARTSSAASFAHADPVVRDFVQTAPEAVMSLNVAPSQAVRSHALDLERWTEGMQVNLPLPDGSVRPATVNLVVQEGEWFRAGGSLPDNGS